MFGIKQRMQTVENPNPTISKVETFRGLTLKLMCTGNKTTSNVILQVLWAWWLFKSMY